MPLHVTFSPSTPSLFYLDTSIIPTTNCHPVLTCHPDGERLGPVIGQLGFGLLIDIYGSKKVMTIIVFLTIRYMADNS